MKKIIAKPHVFFFGLALIFIVITFLIEDKSLEINIYGVYFIASYYYFYLFSAIFFFMIGLNYFSLVWTEKPPKKWLTITHIFLQIIAIFLFITSNNWSWLFNSDNLTTTNVIIIISFLIFVLSVFVHLINFFTSLFLKSE